MILDSHSCLVAALPLSPGPHRRPGLRPCRFFFGFAAAAAALVFPHAAAQPVPRGGGVLAPPDIDAILGARGEGVGVANAPGIHGEGLLTSVAEDSGAKAGLHGLAHLLKSYGQDSHALGLSPGDFAEAAVDADDSGEKFGLRGTETASQDKPNGSPCTQNEECESGTCGLVWNQKKCKAPPPPKSNGSTCDKHDECRSGTCSCATHENWRQVCTCGTSNASNNEPAEPEPTNGKPIGSLCTQDEECESGNCAWMFAYSKCHSPKPLKSNGSTCNKDEECQSDTCSCATGTGWGNVCTCGTSMATEDNFD